jgi:hypothetical protein
MGGVLGGNLDRRRDDVMTTACLWIMLVAWDARPNYVPAPGCHDSFEICEQAARANAVMLPGVRWKCVPITEAKR